MSEAATELAIDRLRQIHASTRNARIKELALDAIKALIKPTTIH